MHSSYGKAGGRVLVLGKGVSGKAAARLALAGGAEAAEFAEGFDLVVASPGIRVMSELEYACRALKDRGVKMLAVTGSKGKSSVVKLVADALNLAGKKAVACGNYGLAASEVASAAELPQWAVVEVSSFMMETTNLPPDTFEAAALLNLQEDHLDRHGSVELYHALKRRLLDCAKKTVSASAADVPEGTYFDNEVLRPNGAAAAELMRSAGLGEDEIECAFRDFVPLPHRMQEVARIDGVRYIDDSKATSLRALEAAVTMAGHGVRLIAGGLPKGDDPGKTLLTLTGRVKKVYLIGECAESFAAAWKEAVDCEICGEISVAVEKARAEAVDGDTVLLSPGAASFDQFKSFEERGEVFARLVKKEG